jgi:SAM-dependent methyltransferase
MTRSSPDWQAYHKWNRRDERMAELWVRGLKRRLREWPGLDRRHAVLDYGCGYFDVGLAIADRVGRVDGFDPDARTVDMARGRAGVRSASFITSERSELPRAAYDLIVVNSVFQYLKNDGEVLDVFNLFHALLRPGGRGEVLLGDLIPPTYSSVKDAFRSLRVAFANGVLVSMVAHLWKAAMKGGGLNLFQIAPDRIAALASEAGFTCERLAVNVTPSRQRYSCVLKLK